MKFGQPLLSTELRGKLGGVVGSVARGGVGYFRVRARPGNPRTLQQTLVRAGMAAAAASWRGTLTDAQRSAWSAYAGDSESGIDVYCKSMAYQQQAGNPLFAPAPTSSINLPNSPLVGVVVDASAHTVTVPTAVGADQACLVYVARQQSPSRGSQQFPFQFAGVIGEGDTSLTLTSQQPGYNLTAGQISYVKVVYIGITGTPTYAGASTIPQVFREVVVA